MAKAKRLPSGNYRVRVFAGKDAFGKAIYKSFTDPDKHKAELMASEYLAGIGYNKNSALKLTVGQAFDNYIKLKAPSLSPTTIREYERIKRNKLEGIMELPITSLTPDVVQQAMNIEIAKGISPKTARNIHGLLSSVVKHYYPDLTLRTTLPKKVKTEIKIPTKEEVYTILEYVKDTEMELPIVICSGIGLRRSELCALQWEDVDFTNNTITINKAMVQDNKKEWVIKSPKSVAGYRTIFLPEYVLDVLKKYKKPSGNITELNPNTVGNRFKRLLEKLDIPHYRLHDLRHYTASVMLALNVPNKYAMQIMGHETDNMLNKVYQHTMEDEMLKVSQKMNEFYKNMT